MLTNQDMLLNFMSRQDVRFIIPAYQRSYAWTQRQCKELMVDILRAGEQGTSHFMSMVLFLDKGTNADGIHRFDIIDGQQRLATATIMLLAFEKWLRVQGEAKDAPSPDELRDRYLINGVSSKGKPTAKIRLLYNDASALEALIADVDPSPRASQRVLGNYAYFLEAFDEEGFDPDIFWRGLQQLLIITTELDEEDAAQEIFESLNTKGLPLTTADLVRNYLLVAEDHEEQHRLYEEYWNPIELMFGDDPGAMKLNAGIRMWLSIRFRKMRIHDKSQTYNAFKAYMTTEFEGTTDELLDELRSFCLMWAENYKFNEVKEFRCMDWAKGKPKTLLPQWGHQSGF